MNNLWFIDPNRNDKFSKLNNLELQQLLNELDNYYLTYRENLNLPEFVSFGLELEYQNVSNEIIKEYLTNNLSTWQFVEEKTLDNGGEINSPKMFDKSNYWKELKQVCDYLKQNAAEVSDSASSHVHVGVQVLGSSVDNWRKFIKAYIVYESILSRFFYGDKINPRKTLMDYAYPIADILYTEIEQLNKLKNIEDLIYLIPRRQFQAVDFRKVKFYDLDRGLYKAISRAHMILTTNKIINFEKNSQIYNIPIDNVLYFEKLEEETYASVVTKDNSYLTDKTLKKWESELQGDPRFIRTFRNYIVNAYNIRKIDLDKEEIYFENNKKALVSRTYKKIVKEIGKIIEESRV